MASTPDSHPAFDAAGRLLAEPAPGDNAPALSVSELAFALKRVVEDSFGQVRLRGEISGWKRAASGHAYLTLKDDKACIDAVMWKTGLAGLAFRPEDGIEVIATGKLTTYPGRSKYQIVIERLELAGEGALMLLLEKLKARLAAEGLFDRARKKPLPFLPRRIGIVTSPTGAVIRDILHRLADRCPSHVIVWPVMVQGQGAIWWLAGSGSRGAGVKGPETREVLRHEEEPVSPVIVGPAVAPIDIPPVQQVPEPEPEALVEMPATYEATPAPSGPSDELTRMKGVGPKVAALLNGMGVTRFDQIAAWDDADIARVDSRLGAFKGRIARDQWVEQARLLAAGDTAGYEARFGKLG